MQEIEIEFVVIDGQRVELEFIDEFFLMHSEMTLTEAIENLHADPLWPVRLHMWRHANP